MLASSAALGLLLLVQVPLLLLLLPVVAAVAGSHMDAAAFETALFQLSLALCGIDVRVSRTSISCKNRSGSKTSHSRSSAGSNSACSSRALRCCADCQRGNSGAVFLSTAFTLLSGRSQGIKRRASHWDSCS